MQGLLEKFSFARAKSDLPQIKTGQFVKVHQKIKEGNKERIQIFEGLVIATHRRQGTNATITVRKESYGIGVERIFPLSAPFIEKIEVIKQAKVRRAKLFYMRERTGKAARMKIIGNNKPAKNKNKTKNTAITENEIKKDTDNQKPAESMPIKQENQSVPAETVKNNTDNNQKSAQTEATQEKKEKDEQKTA